MLKGRGSNECKNASRMRIFEGERGVLHVLFLQFMWRCSARERGTAPDSPNAASTFLPLHLNIPSASGWPLVPLHSPQLCGLTVFHEKDRSW
jgi:hypothetical protein